MRSTRTWMALAALLAGGLLLPACGRYGPPERTVPPPSAAAGAATAPPAPASEPADEEEMDDDGAFDPAEGPDDDPQEGSP